MKDLELHVPTEVGTPDERGRVTVALTQPAVKVLMAWDSDQQIKALHESGHTVVAALLGVAAKTIDIKNKFGGCSILDSDDDERPSIVRASAHLDKVVIALAGREAEILVLGEPTNGNSSDVSDATRFAKAYFEGGMDPTALAGGIDLDYFSPLPTALGEALLSSIIETMTTARGRARELVTGHRDQIVALARIVYDARRLSDAALTAALREIGLDPDAAKA